MPQRKCCQFILRCYNYALYTVENTYIPMENIITGFIIYMPILSLTRVFIYQSLTIYYAPWFV